MESQKCVECTKNSNVCGIGISKGGRKYFGAEIIFERVMVQNFPDLIESHRFIVKKL